MEEIYRSCPEFENNDYILRMVRQEDRLDLLKVYSDKEVVSFFNSDNCGGDDFYYTTENRMQQAIDYWLFEYNRQGFVRWTIISKETHEAIGTIELFHRDAADYFTDCGLLRLDIRSDYEMSDKIIKILSLMAPPPAPASTRSAGTGHEKGDRLTPVPLGFPGPVWCRSRRARARRLRRGGGRLRAGG